MSAGVDVNIGADTRDFASAVKSGMVEPVQDAQGALDKYVDAAGDGGEQLTRTFKTQQQQTTELRSDIDRLNDTISNGTRRSTQTAGAANQRFSRESSEGFDEIRDSAKSNAIEVGASFTGGFDQAAGGLQGFLAEFLAGFGPAGVVAGIAAAAGIGLITAQVDEGTEAAETQKAAIQALGQEYIEAGKSGSKSFDSVSQAISDMATSTDGKDVIITLQKAWEASKDAGADYQSVVEAIANQSPAQIARAQQAVAQLAQKNVELSQKGVQAGNGQYAGSIKAVEGARKLDAALESAKTQAEQAARAQKLAAAAGISDLKLKQDLLGQLEQGYDETASSTDDYLDKEKKTLDVAKYIKAMNARRDALIKYKETLAKLDLSPEAVKFIESQGADAAAAMVAGYQKASPKQQAKLNEIWSTAGDDNATTYDAALGKKLATIKPKAVKIPQSVVPAPDDSKLQAYLRTPRVAKVVVDFYARNGQRIP